VVKPELIVTVSAPTSAAAGAPVALTMKVTNKGTVTTHGGAFVVQRAYSVTGKASATLADHAASSSCRSGTSGLTCDVGTVKPGQSRVFTDAVSAAAPATAVDFTVRWEYTPPGGATEVSSYRREVSLRPGLPSSEVASPPTSGVPGSGAPSSPGAPSSAVASPPSSGVSGSSTPSPSGPASEVAVTPSIAPTSTPERSGT
jgi:hypothetical protein